MLQYRTYAAGPERAWVVFVHGAGGSSSIWYKQIRDFREHFNVLLIDLRGQDVTREFADGLRRDLARRSEGWLKPERIHFLPRSLDAPE